MGEQRQDSKWGLELNWVRVQRTWAESTGRGDLDRQSVEGGFQFLSSSAHSGERGSNTIDKGQNNFDGPDSQCRPISMDFCLLGTLIHRIGEEGRNHKRTGLRCKSGSAQVHNVCHGCSNANKKSSGKNRCPLEFSRKIDKTGEENWEKLHWKQRAHNLLEPEQTVYEDMDWNWTLVSKKVAP